MTWERIEQVMTSQEMPASVLASCWSCATVARARPSLPLALETVKEPCRSQHPHRPAARRPVRRPAPCHQLYRSPPHSVSSWHPRRSWPCQTSPPARSWPSESEPRWPAATVSPSVEIAASAALQRGFASARARREERARLSGRRRHSVSAGRGGRGAASGAVKRSAAPAPETPPDSTGPETPPD